MVFLNVNKGNTWSPITLNDAEFNTYDIIISDVNNDQRPDVIESNSDNINYYYINLSKDK